MFDPDFDPLRELEVCKHNTMELARGMNQYSQFLKELSDQHRELVKLIGEARTRIYQLEIELDRLKKHQ